MPRDVQDAVAGGMWGLLIGDALGVPYEFQTGLDRVPPEMIDMPPPAALGRRACRTELGRAAHRSVARPIP